MYTTAQPFMDLYVVMADGSSKNITSAFDDQVSDPVWSPDGARAVLPRRQQQDLRRDGVSLHASPSRSSSRSSAGRSRTAGSSRPPGGVVAAVEDATHPGDLWMFGASGQRTRITDAQSAARALHVQQAGAVLLPQRRRRAAGRAALQAGRPRRRTTRCRSSPGSTRS